MAYRTISARTLSSKVCQDEDSKVFTSNEYADAAVTSNSRCVGGTITFSAFRSWGKAYWFEVYIGGEYAFETKESNEQNSSEHEETFYIDTGATINHDVVLKGSGEIEVIVHDESYPYNDDVCGFYDPCDVTIEAYHELIPTRCTAPTSVTVRNPITELDTNTLEWKGAKAGTNNAISGYFIQYCDSSDGTTWGSWVEHPTQPSGVVSSFTVEMPEENMYRKFKVWTLGAAGTDYRSSTGKESAATRRGHANLEGFTDSPLVVGETYVKALHMQELQDRANTLRGYYGLSAYNFTTIKSGETGLKDWTAHVNEVRAAVDAISTNHAAWITISTNCPRADVIEQLRAVILAM